ncbi:MAG: hypothetical protein AB1442_03270 [Nitrospirota bacterium]
MSHWDRRKRILRKVIAASGAIVRSAIGIGAGVLLFFSMKKKGKS